MHLDAELLSFLGLRLANPATPWVVLVLCTVAWLALYLMVTSGSRS